MQLQSSVYFDISAKLCYLWTRSDPNRYIVDLNEQEKEQTIPVHLNDDKNRNESELMQCVQDFCRAFVANTQNKSYLNKLTYLVSLKDNAGLVKMYAFVDVRDYQKVVVKKKHLLVIKQ